MNTTAQHGKRTRGWGFARLRVAFLLAFTLIAGAGWLEGATVPPRLTGIVQLGNTPAALLELTEPRNGMVTTPILRAGDRQEAFELLEINKETGRVVMNSPMGKQTLQLYPDRAPANAILQLNQARLEQVLDVYQELGNFTVLHPTLISSRINFPGEPAQRVEEALPALEKVLSENGLTVEHRGMFVLIVPKYKAEVLSAIPAPPTTVSNQSGSPAPKSLSPGLVKFQQTDLFQALGIYAELANRNLLTSRVLPPAKVTVRSQTSMSLEEAIWMMETLLRLEGIATVPAGKSFIFVVPVDKAKTLPVYDEKASAAKTTSNGSMSQLKFDGAPLKSLLGLYAELTGREALPMPADIPDLSIWFQGRKPLTRPESIFALESLAVLNGVRLHLVGEKQVELIKAQ